MFPFILCFFFSHKPEFSVPPTELFIHEQTLTKGSTLHLNFASPGGIFILITRSGHYRSLQTHVHIANATYSLAAPGFLTFGAAIGRVLITALKTEQIRLIGTHFGSLCSEVHSAAGEKAFPSLDPSKCVCYFRTSWKSDVSFSGSLPAGAEIRVRRGTAQTVVKKLAKEKNVDVLILKPGGGSSANLKMRWSGRSDFGSVVEIGEFAVRQSGRVVAPPPVAPGEAAKRGKRGIWWAIWWIIDLIGAWKVVNFALRAKDVDLAGKLGPKGREYLWIAVVIGVKIVAMVGRRFWYVARIVGVLTIVEIGIVLAFGAGMAYLWKRLFVEG